MDEPLVRFFRVLPAATPWREPTHGQPRRARPDGTGLLPHRQAQYCEPSRVASAMGYYAFLPCSFAVHWHGGREFLISFDEEGSWYHLTSVQYPGSFEAWDAVAPDDCKGYCPPFVSVNQDETLQIWTGWFAQTRPGYSLWVLPPVNLSGSPHYEILSGAIETDHWFGPLFTNVKFKATGLSVKFDALFPFIQVVPFERAAFTDNKLAEFIVSDDGIPPELFAHYYETLVKKRDRLGHYAVQARRAARRE